MKRKYLIATLATSLLLSGCNAANSPNTNESENKVNSKIETSVPKSDEASSKEVEEVKDEKPSEEDKTLEETSYISSSGYGVNIPNNQSEMSAEDIISKYKKIFNIDNIASIKDVSIDENSDGKFKTYAISYTGEDGESITLNTDMYGNLIFYSTYFSNEKSEKLTDDAPMDAINRLLKDLYGEKSSGFIIEENKAGYTMGDPNLNFTAKRAVNNIPLDTDFISITYDSKLNLITNVSVTTETNYDFSDTSYFPDSKNLSTVDEAYTKFKEVNKLYRGFLGSYDYNNETINYSEVLATLDKTIPLDAKTLEPLYNYSDQPLLDSPYRDYEKSEAAGDSASLSPEEQKAVDLNKSQKTLSEAEKKARELFNLEGYKLSYSNLSSIFNSNDKKIWNLSFSKDGNEDIVMSFLADKLTLESYGNYGTEIKTGNEIKDSESIISIANEFLSEKAAMNLKDLHLTEQSKYLGAGDVHSLTYIRKISPDSYIISDKIQVTINKKTGEVLGFNKYWDYDIKPKELSKKTSEEEAYNLIKDKLDFNLRYIPVKDSEKISIKLAYKLSNGSSPWSSNIVVDDEIKKVTDEFGSNFEDEDELNYEDIDDAKDPEKIKELARFKIGYFDEKLNPKDQVKEIDFLKILASDISSPTFVKNASDEDIYDLLESNDILDKDDKNPERLITQADLARYMIRFKGYNDVASHNNIFKDDYLDIDSSDKDYGYLVLAKEFNIIESENKKLEPRKKITREQALYDFYNYKQFEINK